MITDKNLVIDGFLTLEGGMDSGVDPSLLEKNKTAENINCITRGGVMTHRPPFRKRFLEFGGNSILETRATTGRFQVAGRYQPDNGPEFIVASIGGRVFKFSVVGGYQVQELTITYSTLSTADFTIPALGDGGTITLQSTANISPGADILFGGFTFSVVSIIDANNVLVSNVDGIPGQIIVTGTPFFFYDTNPATKDRAWYKQTEKWAIIQNNQNLAIIFDGATCRRAVPEPPSSTDAKEVPTGNVMEYAMNRLAVTLPDFTRFAIGDLVYSSSGTPAEGFRDSVLKFTQNTFQNQQKYFTVPQTAGGIKSMNAVPIQDGALNQGPLVVGTPTIMFTVSLPTDADTWANLTNPIQTVPIYSNGPVNDRGTILVNSDFWFRAVDGWRSYILARRDFNTWANTAVSDEIEAILKLDDPGLLDFESGVFFDGRVIKTCSPARSQFGVYHRALAVLDLNRVSGLRPKEPPAYDGFWTGLNTLQLVQGLFGGIDRCFAFSLNFNGHIELFEILKEGEFDDIGQGDTPIKWSFETAVYGRTQQRGGGIFDVKRLENGEVWIDKVESQVYIRSWYRPVGAACWNPWRTDLNVCAKNSPCGDLPLGECQDTTNYKQQYRSRIGFGRPNDDCDRNMDRPAHTAEGHQARLEIRGHCRIRGLRMFWRALDEPLNAAQC